MQTSQLQTHIAYTLEEADQLSKLGLKMLMDSDDRYLLRVSRVLCNGQERLLYHTEGMGTLISMTHNLSEQMVLNFLTALAQVLGEIQEKAFWEQEFIVLDPERIFIRPDDMMPAFLLVPVTRMTTGQLGREWLDELVRLLEILQGMKEEADNTLLKALFQQVSAVRQIPDQQPMDQLQAMKQLPEMIRSGFAGMKITMAQPQAVPQNAGGTPQEIELRYRGQLGAFSFYISRENFLIGKNPDCDGVININPAISRRHCRIQKKEDGWYLSDQGSSNHTYLGGRMLAQGEEVLLHDQDVIRLADMDFTLQFPQAVKG